MENKTNEAILQTLRKIEDRQASMDRDMEKDRQDLQNLTIEVQGVKAEMAQFRKAINLNAERTRDKLAEAVVPVVQATDKLTGEIKKSKMVALKQAPKKWWHRLLGGE